MPFSQIFPSTGRYIIQHKHSRGFGKQVFLPTVDALQDYVQKYEGPDNLFHAVGSFGDDDNRTGDNAVAFRSFIWEVDTWENVTPEEKQRDIDLGRLKFETKKDALEHVLGVLRQRNFVEPNHIIESSAGWHLYWKLDADTTPDVWQHNAQRFKTFIIETMGKAAADVSRVADRASVLRPPGSIHRKKGRQPFTIVETRDDPPITLQVFLDGLDRFKKAPATPTNAKPRVVLDASLDELRDPSGMLSDCVAMKHYQSVASTASYDSWRSAVGLSAYTTGGEDLAHALSDQYPGYSPTETTEKYVEFEANRKKGKGPIRCVTWRQQLGLKPTVCAGCRFASSATASPVNLGKTESQVKAAAVAAPQAPAKTQPASPPPPNQPPKAGAGAAPKPGKPPFIPITDADIKSAAQKSSVYAMTKPQIPERFDLHRQRRSDPFFIDAAGRLMMWERDNKDEPMTTEDMSNVARKSTMVVEGAVWPVRKYKEGDEDVTLFYRTERAAGVGYTVTSFPVRGNWSVKSDVFEARVLKGHQMRQKHPHVKQLLIDTIIDESQRLSWNSSAARNGWEDLDGCKGDFQIGGIKVSKTGVKPAEVHGDATSLKKLYGIDGTLDEWTKIMDAYAQHGSPVARLIMVSSFAAPLWGMAPIQSRGLWLHMSGGTGLGKSTLTATALSVWGRATNDAITARDTDKSLENSFGALGSLPVVIDELTVADPAMLNKLPFVFSSGQANKARTQNGPLRQQDIFWNTIMMTSANMSMVQKLEDINKGHIEAMSAKLARVLEMELKAPVVELNTSYVIDDIAKKNYGLAGPVFMHYVENHRNKIERDIRDAYRKISHMDKHKDGSEAKRFMHALRACLVVTNQILRKLGFWSFDSKALLQDLNDVIVFHTKRTKLAEAHDHVAGYLERFNQAVIDVDPVNKRHLNTLLGVNTGAMVYREIVGNDAVFYIPSQKLEDYCRRRNTQVSSVLAVHEKRGTLVSDPDSRSVCYQYAPNVPPTTAFGFKYPRQEVAQAPTSNVVPIRSADEAEAAPPVAVSELPAQSS